jgi:hypothetical protein
MVRISVLPPFHAVLMIATMTLLLAVSFYYTYNPPELLPCTTSVATAGPTLPPLERRRMETLQRVNHLQDAKRSAIRERDILQNSGHLWGEGHPEKKASREQRARKEEEEIEWMTTELAGLTTELNRLEHEIELARRSKVVYDCFGRGGAWALWFVREVFPPLKHFTCAIVFHEEW